MPAMTTPRRVGHAGGRPGVRIGIMLAASVIASAARAQTTFKIPTLFQFTGSSGIDPGSTPLGNLLAVPPGVLYGTTFTGGTYGCGTVFEAELKDGSWSETPTYNFMCPPSNGAYPDGALIPGPVGILYGTTSRGGTSDLGTVFSLTVATGTLTVLHSFSGGDGENPSGALALNRKGDMLYGTTFSGGTYNLGTVFGINLSALELPVSIYSFGQQPDDGAYPLSGVVAFTPPNGPLTLYGTTSSGGQSDNGAVFALPVVTPPAKPAIFSFNGQNGDNPNGAGPMSALFTPADEGVLYGTTFSGGDSGMGTVFEFNPSAAGSLPLTTLYSFTGGSDGANPQGSVVLYGSDLIFGTTRFGGGSTACPSGCGTVFGLQLNAGIWTLSQFGVFTGANSGSGQGEFPSAGLIVSGEALYGATAGASDPPPAAAKAAENNGSLFKVQCTTKPPCCGGCAQTQ